MFLVACATTLLLELKDVHEPEELECFLHMCLLLLKINASSNEVVYVFTNQKH